MKAFKFFALLWLMFSVASAVTNWGNDFTKNPVVVFIVLFVSAIAYTIADFYDN